MTPRRKKSDDPTPPNKETPSSAPSADPTSSDTTSTTPPAESEAPSPTTSPETAAAAADDGPGCCDQWPLCDHNLDDEENDEIAAPATPDLEGAIDRLSQSIGDRVFVMNDDWERLMGLLQTVEETAAEHETCKKAASDAKKDHESAQAALQRALTRMRDGLKPTDEPTLPFDRPGAADGLPHGGVHQSDVVQAAHDDPAVVSLTERLTAIRWDVTPELVAGWTVDERAQLVAWLDGMGVKPALAEGQPDPALVPFVEFYERDNGIDAGHWRFVPAEGEPGPDSTGAAGEWQFRNDATEEWRADPSQEQIARWWREGRLAPIHATGDVPTLPDEGPAATTQDASER